MADDSRYRGLERVVADSGGEKERRAARFELLPWGALWHVAEVYAHGAEKYGDDNWRRGYPLSLSTGALSRHVAAIMAGEDVDPESGLLHAGHASFHTLAIVEHTLSGRLRELDDRWTGPGAWPPRLPG